MKVTAEDMRHFEVVWMSELEAQAFSIKPAERIALNRCYVDRWLTMYAPENRNPN